MAIVRCLVLTAIVALLVEQVQAADAARDISLPERKTPNGPDCEPVTIFRSRVGCEPHRWVLFELTFPQAN